MVGGLYTYILVARPGIDYSLPEYICLKIYSRIKKITQVLQSTNIVDWFCLFCNEK